MDDLFFRGRNCELYTLLVNEPRLKLAAKKAGLSYNYALTLMKRWVAAGYLIKQPVFENKYIYTQKGLRMLLIIQDAANELRDEDE